MHASKVNIFFPCAKEYNTITVALLVAPTSLLVAAALALVTRTMLWDAGSMSLQKAIKWL